MKIIGAGLGDVVDDRSGIAPVFGAEVVGDDLDFLQRVLVAEEQRRAADGIVVVVLPVNFKIVGTAALSVGGNAGTIAVAEGVVMSHDHARGEQRNVVEGISNG